MYPGRASVVQLLKYLIKVYSDDSTPYGPINFLTTTWKASTELSGHAQQDAHEFFISALNQIHSTSRGSTNVSCNCVIHSTFSGQLQSDVKCERCGNITSTVDPMMDVSLEIGRGGNGRPGAQGAVAAKNGTGTEGSAGENTLAACLRRSVPDLCVLVSCYFCSISVVFFLLIPNSSPTPCRQITRICQYKYRYICAFLHSRIH